MSKNTFSAQKLTALREAIRGYESVLIKRPRAYSKAVVAGVPDKPEALIISFVSFIDNPNRSYWLVHESESHDPKSLADGISDDVFGELSEHRFYRWDDLTDFVVKWSSTINNK